MLSRLRTLLGRGNGERPETTERQKEATLQRKKAAMEPSSHPKLLTKKQLKKEMERLNTELQLVTSQRNELRGRLLFITEGTVDNRPYHKPNPFYEKLKLEHKQAMLELKRLHNEKSTASERCSELTKETVFYRGLYSRLLMEQTQMKKKVDMLRQENRKLLDDWVLLKHHLEEMKVLCKEEEEGTSDPKPQQYQELKRLEEMLELLMKQKETAIQERELAEKLQRHLEVSQMRFKTIQTELEQATSQEPLEEGAATARATC